MSDDWEDDVKLECGCVVEIQYYAPEYGGFSNKYGSMKSPCNQHGGTTTRE
ncbi:gp087 [Rhodococcus phage ReqiDocB7]|uniref:gp087 n=1 Tax=Rhodococcus phage ReqiDocB7 TaxID=691966 RepID=UPI0001CDD870|nr:gp087 [Rhodococcus phage ReqiDocB7]ADD80873.1 gp087 [Rhodococcus phage ReqiDocB7]